MKKVNKIYKWQNMLSNIWSSITGARPRQPIVAKQDDFSANERREHAGCLSLQFLIYGRRQDRMSNNWRGNWHKACE